MDIKEQLTKYLTALETRCNQRLATLLPYDIDPRWMEPRQALNFSREEREVAIAYDNILRFPKHLVTETLRKMPTLAGVSIKTEFGDSCPEIVGKLNPTIRVLQDGELVCEVLAAANFHTNRKDGSVLGFDTTAKSYQQYDSYHTLHHTTMLNVPVKDGAFQTVIYTVPLGANR